MTRSSAAILVLSLISSTLLLVAILTLSFAGQAALEAVATTIRAALHLLLSALSIF